MGKRGPFVPCCSLLLSLHKTCVWEVSYSEIVNKLRPRFEIYLILVSTRKSSGLSLFILTPAFTRWLQPTFETEEPSEIIGVKKGRYQKTTYIASILEISNASLVPKIKVNRWRLQVRI